MNRRRSKHNRHAIRNNGPSLSFLEALEEQRRHQSESKETKTIPIKVNANYFYDEETNRYYKKPRSVYNYFDLVSN